MLNFGSGPLGTGAGCFQTETQIHGGNCSNFAAGRTLSINGVAQSCNNFVIPATRVGGYCIVVGSGDASFAAFVTF
jgi:hypothetical protein